MLKKPCIARYTAFFVKGHKHARRDRRPRRPAAVPTRNAAASMRNRIGSTKNPVGAICDRPRAVPRKIAAASTHRFQVSTDENVSDEPITWQSVLQNLLILVKSCMYSEHFEERIATSDFLRNPPRNDKARTAPPILSLRGLKGRGNLREVPRRNAAASTGNRHACSLRTRPAVRITS